MPILPRLSSLWRNLVHKARKDQELTEEIDAYLEMLIEQKTAEGLDPVEARRAALIELGGREQVKEKVREARAGHLIETLWQDLRYALRMLMRNPGFACVAILTLALGIGGATTIFSAIQNILLDPFPYADANRVVSLQIHDTSSSRPDGRNWFQTPEFLDYQEQSHLFDEVIGVTLEDVLYDNGAGMEQFSG
ncbi:MAG TPA: permease prefix domain 1-containing protein, partial [Blastocatellia bacterium]|nr:permease prefix domain 1-containing protein [Blastocatellia bacterium]